MNDIVYVLVEDNSIDYMERVLVFSSLEQANAKLLELKEDFECRNNIDSPRYVVEDNTEDNTNEPMFSYCVYEEGNYYNHHYNLTIYQREIM